MNAIATLPPVPARSLRHADLKDLFALLQVQHRQKVDVIVPVSTLHTSGGALMVGGLEPVITEDGVTEISGLYRPTGKATADLLRQFAIPVPYGRRMAADNVELFDANINSWAGADTSGAKVLLRLFYGADPNHPDTVGILRSVLSDKYGFRDNLDVFLAALDGMRAAGLDAQNISSVSLSDDRLYMFVEAPEVQTLAPKLLEGYRSPWAGTAHGGVAADTTPVVHAGFVVQNSETGLGALSVTPRIKVRICDNGLTMTKDALRKVHLGSRLPEGQIAWKADTVKAVDESIKLQMRDAVTAFLTEDYLTSAVSKLEETSGVPVSDAAKTIEVVGKQLSYTQDEQAGILSHFIRGGQVTAGGIMQAVTSFAQEIEDVDRQNEFEATGVEAMLAAARVAV